MQRHKGQLLFAASDSFHFAGGQHRTTLDLVNLGSRLTLALSHYSLFGKLGTKLLGYLANEELR